MKPNFKQLYSISQLIDQSGYSLSTLRRYIKAGIIKASVQLGKRNESFYDDHTLRVLLAKKRGEDVRVNSKVSRRDNKNKRR